MKITIDGPAASGKGTVARALAQSLKFSYIDNGLIFRAMTYVGLPFLEDIEYSFFDGKSIVKFQGINITYRCYESSLALKTAELCRDQDNLNLFIRNLRRIVKESGINNFISDGRGVGIAIFPEAEVKIYLDADIQIRTMRRYEDLKRRGFDVEFDDVLESLKTRDRIDKERLFAPLKIPQGAFVLDTSKLTVEQVVKLIEEYVLNINPEIRL